MFRKGQSSYEDDVTDSFVRASDFEFVLLISKVREKLGKQSFEVEHHQGPKTRDTPELQISVAMKDKDKVQCTLLYLVRNYGPSFVDFQKKKTTSGL